MRWRNAYVIKLRTRQCEEESNGTERKGGETAEEERGRREEIGGVEDRKVLME